MDKTLLEMLKKITPEEEQILSGDDNVQKELYTSEGDFIIDSNKMLERGRLMDIRPHTRFVHFPRHRHNYVEIIYMCSGSTTHIINGEKRVVLEAGDLLFLNQHVTQEILPAAIDDIAINFIVLPEFFNRAFVMMEDENVLRDFIISSLQEDTETASYLHFEAKNILPVQNLVENMVWTIVNKQSEQDAINQITMGLLFLSLINYADRINRNDPYSYEQSVLFTAFKYIEENYKSASLSEFASGMNQPDYYVSKLIKKYSGYTFKELLQMKRLEQAERLLVITKLPVEMIAAMVGYDNNSYFHRIFKQKFQLTPHVYRQHKK